MSPKLPLLVLFILGGWTSSRVWPQSLKLTRSSGPIGVQDFGVDASGRWVVVLENGQLFSRRLERLTAPVLISGSLISTPGFVVSPDGMRVAFLVESTGSVYSAPIDGLAEPIRLNDPPGPVDVGAIQITPDGGRVVYSADEDGDLLVELRSAPIDGSTASVKLFEPILTPHFAVSPEGGRVVFHAYLTDPNQRDLYSVPADGSGSAVKLNQPLPGLYWNTDVQNFRISPLGEQVVFWAERNTAATPKLRLFSVPIDGSALPLQISGNGGHVRYSPVPTSSVPFAISPDGARVVYVAENDQPDLFELFSVPIDGSSSPIQLNGPLVSDGDVHVLSFNALPFRISPDGTRVAYSADQDVNEVIELYQVPIGSSETPVKLNGPLQPGRIVRSFEFDPTGAALAYVANQDSASAFELYGVPAGGGSPALKLNDSFGPGGNVAWFSFDPTGTMVAFSAIQGTGGDFGIYRSPIGEFSSSRRISPDPAGEGEVLSFPVPRTRRGNTGSHVLFTGDLSVTGISDLYLGFLQRPVLPAPAASQPE